MGGSNELKLVGAVGWLEIQAIVCSRKSLSQTEAETGVKIPNQGTVRTSKELSQNTRPVTSLNVFQDYLYGSAKRIRRSHMSEREKLGTIWEVSDELWERIEPVILEEDPPKARGRKRADAREMLNGIIFRLRSGCQWNQLPKELGDDSTIHRTLQRWVELGVMRRVWAALIEGCDELGGVQWEWQAADAAMSKARLGGT